MSNVQAESQFCGDSDNIGRDAKNKKDRRFALEKCLAGRWKQSDIGRLERVDTTNQHGWRMSRWKKEAS
ncbi:MAG: hypothetical protein JSU70_07665 [Phycisphaerales bacterium]|nr:MAG: hypothetical protein JSU70_07665 [Phycisphaerales bacterium]